jgi:flavodoxin
VEHVPLLSGKELNKDGDVKILIVFYSRYGNTARMTEEEAYSAKELERVRVTMRRIADDIPLEQYFGKDFMY